MEIEQFIMSQISADPHNEDDVDNTVYDRHPPNILQTIYLSAVDLPSFFIRHSNNEVEIHRATIASEPTYSSHRHMPYHIVY